MSNSLGLTDASIQVSTTTTIAAAAAKSFQLGPTLCDPIDGSPPGSPNPGILQARTLEWVAISFSNAWKWKVKVKLLHCVQLLVSPWTAAHQAPLSMGFSRQGYWSGVPSPSPPQPWGRVTYAVPTKFPWLPLCRQVWPHLQSEVVTLLFSVTGPFPESSNIRVVDSVTFRVWLLSLANIWESRQCCCHSEFFSCFDCSADDTPCSSIHRWEIIWGDSE